MPATKQNVSDCLNVTEMAQRLGIARSTAYEMIRNGALPGTHFAGAVRCPKPAWDAWFNSQSRAALDRVQNTL